MIAGTGWTGSTPPGWGRRSAARPPGMRGGSPPGRTAGPMPGRHWASCWPGGTRAERAALPDPAAARPLPAEAALHAVADVHGDDEDAEEIFDDPADGDFYADAFEILE